MGRGTSKSQKLQTSKRATSKRPSIEQLIDKEIKKIRAEQAKQKLAVTGAPITIVELADRLNQPLNKVAKVMLPRYDFFVKKWEFHVARAGAERNKETLQDQTQAKSRSLKPLAQNAADQKSLVAIAQDCQTLLDQYGQSQKKGDLALVDQVSRLNSRARELFILCHQGFIEQTIQRHVHQFDGEPPEEALHVLRQEAWSGLNKGIDRYDFTNAAKPLTYMRNWIRADISAATEREGRLIRLKSKAHDFGKKVQAEAKKIQNEGRQVTISEIADRLKESPERVAEVLPYVAGPPVRLDAPISHDGEGEDTVGSITIDPDQQVEDPILDDDARSRVRKAVAGIPSPFRRKVIEQFYGLSDNEVVEQKDLFDGVYRDKKGRAFSAEPSVISDRQKRGEKVTKRSQKDLNKLFNDGDLSFEPGTSEAHELALVAHLGDDFDPSQPYDKVITNKNGIPPTSGTIQEAKRKAEEEMRRSPVLAGLAPRYRGENELEQSETAREQVRQALLSLNAIGAKEVSKYKATRGTQGQKSELRKLAEEHDLVDPNSGRLNMPRLKSLTESNSDSEDMAALMSE